MMQTTLDLVRFMRDERAVKVRLMLFFNEPKPSSVMFYETGRKNVGVEELKEFWESLTEGEKDEYREIAMSV